MRSVIKTILLKNKLLLDKIPATEAFSLRKLSLKQKPNCIKVRRDSDNATKVINFDKKTGSLDIIDLLNFAGFNSCFVLEVYGVNGTIASQADNNLQPRIVNNGVIDSANGKPAIYFNGNSSLLFPSINQVVYGFTVHKTIALPSIIAYIAGGNFVGFVSYISDAVVSGGASIGFFSNPNLLCAIPEALDMLKCYEFSPTKLYINSLEAIYRSSSNGTPNPINLEVIGTRLNEKFFFTGYLSEMLLFDSNQASARAVINTNLINYYKTL